jgi:Fe-S cluster assembly protein SufD
MKEIAGNTIISSLTTQFEAFEKQLNGQSTSAVHQARKAAMAQLQSAGLPAARDEEYKFTNLTKALTKNIDFSQPVKAFGLAADKVRATEIADLEAYKLVFLNGEYTPALSDPVSVEGLTVLPFQAALKERAALVEQHFGKNASAEADPFIAMNTAFSMNGIFIEIADKVVVDKPIALYFIGDCTETQLSYQIRNMVVAGKFSQATIIEKFDTIGEHESFTNVVNEFAVADNAHLQYFKIENDTASTYHVSNTYATQETASTFTANTIALNGAMVRNNLNIQLDGEGCESHMNGLYVLKGKTHVDNHTVVDHLKPNSYSNELYKGIMDDRSHGVFNGKIFVRQDAQKTNAFQSNKNILLTDNATINTKPQLEIWADDVKCSHGCTTGQLDMDALFYLQARGIQKQKARAILLRAFASDVLSNIDNEAIKKYLENIITDRLEA